MQREKPMTEVSKLLLYAVVLAVIARGLYLYLPQQHGTATALDWLTWAVGFIANLAAGYCCVVAIKALWKEMHGG